MTLTRLRTAHAKAELAAPCPSCWALFQEGRIDRRDMLTLRGGALDALSVRSAQKICRRCEQMETIMRLAGFGEDLALAPAITDWQEAIRLPGTGRWGSCGGYPMGGLDEWIAYCRRRDAAIPFYQEGQDNEDE